MKGYKGMDKDMKCRGFQFEIGKTYQIDGEIELCKKGFHFCKNLYDVFKFYGKKNENRFFEVETDSNWISDGVKSVSSTITIIRELSRIEVSHCVYGSGNGDGYGYGSGNGYGRVYGSGNGYGNGYVSGSGNGYGNGDDDGNGSGDGYGSGYGDGDGRGYSRGIQKILKIL